MAPRRPTILATGDVTADWSFIDLAKSPSEPISMAWAWSEGFNVSAVSFAGGAARLAEMLTAVARQAGGSVDVVGPALPPPALASPLEAGVTRTFSSIARFPASRTDGTPVWRFDRFWGRHPAAAFATFLPSLEGSDIGVVAINDLGLDYRRRAEAWRPWEEARSPSRRHRDHGAV